MRVSRVVMMAVAFAVVVGCGTDAVGPKTQYDGVKYTATVNTIQSGVSLTQFAVLVTLENMTTATLTRTYPAGCPVRIRLYRDGDGKRVYDETLRVCGFTDPATITLTARATSTLTSGPRLPGTILGDSLPAGTYTVHAVVQTEGTTAVEVGAGSYLIGTGPTG